MMNYTIEKGESNAGFFYLYDLSSISNRYLITSILIYFTYWYLFYAKLDFTRIAAEIAKILFEM